MQSADDASPNESVPTGNPVRLRALLDSAIIEAEACGETMVAADLGAIADRLKIDPSSELND